MKRLLDDDGDGDNSDDSFDDGEDRGLVVCPTLLWNAFTVTTRHDDDNATNAVTRNSLSKVVFILSKCYYLHYICCKTFNKYKYVQVHIDKRQGRRER